MFPNTVERKEIDRALINRLKRIIVLYKPIDVYVRKYDTDFRKVSKPCASIFVTGFSRDDTRQFSFDYSEEISRDTQKNTVDLQKSGFPIMYNYSVDFWSEKQAEMNDMLEQWIRLGEFSKWFNLPVVDFKGINTSLFCLERTGVVMQLEMEETKQADNYRLFHSSQLYNIHTYYGGEVEYDVPLVGEVKFQTEGVKK